jgi:hypothetical protein
VAAPFITRLLEMFCSHRFSWPHTGIHGQDYQVCLHCGAAYEYDCNTMRRTRRLAAPPHTQYEPLLGKPGSQA